MAATLNWTADQLFTVLQGYFAALLSIPVVRGQGNRVPVPAALGDDYAVVTPVFQSMLSQPVREYGGLAETVTFKVGMQWSLQVDFIGPNSQSLAVVAMLPWRSAWGCDQLPDIVPLFVGDAVQSPQIGAEEQFEERWRVEAVISYVAIMTLAQQSAIALEIDLISVDATYPPSE